MQKSRKREKVRKPSNRIRDILKVVSLIPADVNLLDFNARYRLRRLQSKLDFTEQSQVSKEWEEQGQVIKVDNVVENLDDSVDSLDDFLDSLLERKSALDDLVDRFPDVPSGLLALRECTSELPAEFREYIFNTDPQVFDGERETERSTLNFPEKYMDPTSVSDDDADQIRAWLIIAGRRYSQARSWYNSLYKLVDLIAGSSGGGDPAQTTVASLGVIEQSIDVEFINDRVHWVHDEFLTAFDGVDINRLRRCGNCRKVFWLGRTDARGCSKRCAGILRTRDYRERITPEQRAKYKINRIARELKKSKNQEKKDGTL